MKADRNVLAREVEGSRVSRSPIAHLDMVSDVFAKILDEELWKILRSLTSTKVLSCEVRKLSRYLGGVVSPSLLAIIDVEGCKDRQLLNVSAGLVNTIVDFRMGGDPVKTGAGPVRTITEIDMVLCEAFIDRVLHAFARAMAIGLDAVDIPRLTRIEFEQYTSLVNIAPDNADVLVIRTRVDTAQDVEGVEFEVVIPLSALDTFKSASRRSAVPSLQDTSADLWRDHMNNVAAVAAAKLNAVLYSMTMEAQELQALAPGQVIEIPRNCLNKVHLTIDGAAGAALSSGRLGNLEGRKAIKLSDPPDQDLQQSITQSLSNPEADMRRDNTDRCGDE